MWLRTLLVVVGAADLLWAQGSLRKIASPLFEIEGARGRQAAAAKDFRRVVAERFPRPEDIGKEWLRPWDGKLHGRVPGAARSEEAYWASVEPGLIIAQYFGMKEGEARAATGKALEAVLAQARGETPPPEMPEQMVRLLTTDHGLLTVSLWRTRMWNMACIDTKTLIAHRMRTVSAAITRDRIALVTRHERERKAAAEGRDEAMARRHAVEARALQYGELPVMLASFCPDAPDLTAPDLLSVFARESLLIREQGEMHYVQLDPATLTSERPRFALVTVALRVLAREQLDGRVTDVTPENASLVEGELNRLLDELTRTVREMASATSTAMAEGTVRARVEALEYGDNSWAVLFEGPDLPGEEIAPVQARVRNGNAVVNVTIAGTYPREWLRQQLDYFLSAMDERTEVYRE